MAVLTEKEGLITQVIGPVIDVEFASGALPGTTWIRIPRVCFLLVA